MNSTLIRPGSVGMPVFTGDEPQPVPDPSPGVNSVLFDGTIGPTPPEDERREHWGLPPLPQPQSAQAQQTPVQRQQRAAARAPAPPPPPPVTPPAARR